MKDCGNADCTDCYPIASMRATAAFARAIREREAAVDRIRRRLAGAPRSEAMRKTRAKRDPLATFTPFRVAAPVSAEQRQSRNAPCACGSGKKFKRCCGFTADVASPAVPQLVE